MERMTAREFAARFGNGVQTHDSRSSAKLEYASRNGSLAEGKAETSDSKRVHIRFVSVRKRLCDPDNLSEKWLLDCLRYCHIISGDEPDKITLETTQRKAGKGEAEVTIIEILSPD